MHAAMTGQSMDSMLAQAGVAEHAVSGRHCELREVTGTTLLSLHSLTPAEQLTEAISSIGIRLPNAVNQSVGAAPSVLCLRPGEWLLISENGSGGDLRQQLTACTDASRSVVLDRSDGLAVLRLTGCAAPWLLSKLSALDFLHAKGSGQHCARTRMASTAVIVHYHPGDQSVPGNEFCFDLLFDRSLARYMWDLIKASMAHADELAESFSSPL